MRDLPPYFQEFPIAPRLPDILASLATHPRLVLEAPPGAGKTTQVPPALLEAPWLEGRRIVMLEPRRVAARRYIELGGTLEKLTFVDGLTEGRFAEHRLVVAHDPGRAQSQSAKRRERIAELEVLAEKLVGKLDAQDDGVTVRGRRATDRGAYSRFARAVSDAELTRFVRADYQAERFVYHVDEDAITHAERFDSKLVLLTNVDDFGAAQVVERYKSLADIERGFRVLKSDIEIAPVFHRLPDRIRAHALICFLALVLHRVMRMRLKASGSTLSPNAALKALRLVQQLKLTISNQPAIRTSRIDATQRSLFANLNLKPPTENALL